MISIISISIIAIIISIIIIVVFVVLSIIIIIIIIMHNSYVVLLDGFVSRVKHRRCAQAGEAGDDERVHSVRASAQQWRFEAAFVQRGSSV